MKQGPTAPIVAAVITIAIVTEVYINPRPEGGS